MPYRLLCALLGLSAFAQSDGPSKPVEPKPADQSPIRMQVNEVIVPVTVTDDKGRFVSDLDVTDFRIFDEG
jgi:hypothetical protein